MNSSFKDGAQFAFDSTSLGWGETCLRLYQYYMIEGWRPLHKSVHLWFGGHYATALEHYHKHRANGIDLEKALQMVVQEALEATWEGDAPIDYDHPAKTRANLIRTIVWYIDQFASDPLRTVILSDGKPAVEYSFRLELAPDILYCGHIDRLVEDGNTIYVQDQKTTGSTINQRYFDKFAPDIQMSGYAFAGNIIYNSPVKGVIIDAAQIAVGFSRFERGYTFRTPASLDEWRENTLHSIAQIQNATRENKFPMNRSSCDKFGGCAFRTVCSRSPEVRPQFLKAEFVQDKQWNPMESR